MLCKYIHIHSTDMHARVYCNIEDERHGKRDEHQA